MKAEDLLKPRYKVIADWPGVAGKVKPGQILSLDDEFIPDLYWCGGEDFTEDKLKDYPHLFKKLFWWEERAVEDLPKYLKWQNNGKVRKVKEYHIWADGYTVQVEFDGGRRRYLKKEWSPCTEEEYNTYINLSA